MSSEEEVYFKRYLNDPDLGTEVVLPTQPLAEIDSSVDVEETQYFRRYLNDPKGA